MDNNEVLRKRQQFFNLLAILGGFAFVLSGMVVAGMIRANPGSYVNNAAASWHQVKESKVYPYLSDSALQVYLVSTIEQSNRNDSVLSVFINKVNATGNIVAMRQKIFEMAVANVSAELQREYSRLRDSVAVEIRRKQEEAKQEAPPPVE